MNILIIGSGGREHALAWKIKQSQHCERLFIAPGNAGTGLIGTNVDIPSTDFVQLAGMALRENISMIVVGPETPLVEGIYDYFNASPELTHIRVIGPSKAAAQLEGSKAFAKAFMQRHQIPTAAYREFDAADSAEGLTYLRKHTLPVVLKADGLASGKGVLICTSVEDALLEFEQMLLHSKFGTASRKVVVEEFLTGIEFSMFVLTDGNHYLVLPEAKDYKRIGEGDTGLNTGGMGAVSPVPFVDAVLREQVRTSIIVPTITGLQQEKLVYKGIVFIGLIYDGHTSKVIEYNCRFGDPETEVVLPRISNDLVELFCAASDGHLDLQNIQATNQTAVTVIAVSGGYPEAYVNGKPIQGLTQTDTDGTIIFHAGTRSAGEDVVTNGGRVLTVTALGDSVQTAALKSYQTLSGIRFDGMYYRKDIGYEFIP